MSALQPPCVICGAPGVMGVGVVGRAPEAWYCAAHLAEGNEHGARPVRGWSRATA